MNSRISRTLLRVLTSAAMVFASAAMLAAQDPDPNSPTPVLLSESSSTRAIARDPGSVRSVRDLARNTRQAFLPEEKVEIYVSSLDLMEGEGANAFRVYGEDRLGHLYRFPVIAIEPVAGSEGVHRVIFVLKDEVGFWDAPTADGDILLYLTWRGLSSNRVRLGYGATGGDLKEDPNARPTPLGTKAIRTVSRPDSPDVTGYRWAGDALRLQEQATFGPNLTQDNRIRRIGVRSWLNEQFAAQYPSSGNSYPNTILRGTNAAADCDGGADDVPANCGRDTYSMYQPQTWFFKEASYSDAQLKHRVTWALSQIWVTSGNDIQQGRSMVEWYKVLDRHAFGNYRNLMKEMTLNPTMGEYLNMRESTRTAPNENYAREIMQLFSIGLFTLNQDGTERCVEHNPCQAGDTKEATYTQDGVNNLTRVLTGWGLCTVAGPSCPSRADATKMTSDAVNFVDPMVLNLGVTNLNNNRHDLNAKTLLDYPGANAATRDIAACGPTCAAPTAAATALVNIKTYADGSLDKAIDNLYNHPNVGPFVSRILIQQLVTSDPTPAYVSRVAGVFNANRSSQTQMREVIRAILLDPEARGDVKTDPNFGKLREPVLFATNFFRTFNVRGAAGSWQFDGYISTANGAGRGGRSGQFNGMAQVPFLSPTVFNYFPPGYGVPGTTLNGPEFAIMTTGTAVQRANFINAFTFTAIPITVVAPDSPTGLSLDFADLQVLVVADTTSGQLLDELNRRMLHNTMSAQMKSTLQTAVNSITLSGTPTADQTLARVRQAVYLVATSSQYQVQR
jgi:uncharacterized protein (DUF1800 family)